LLEKQKKNNLTHDDVLKQLDDPLYQAIGYLLAGEVDGLIAGSLRPTADVVKAAIQCIGVGTKERFIAGHFLIETEARASADSTPILFADCAVMPEPSVRALAAIALGAAHSYQFFTGMPPRVALLSFSTRGSATHPLVDRLKETVELIRKQDPSLLVDGELQVDAALDPDVAKIKKASDSPVAGRANVFVFPTLEAGNIGYKLVQRFSNARIAGPLLWGLSKPVSDLSRGCTVQEVTDTARCVSAMIERTA
jgi:phosphate acetyltransferase